MKFLCDQMLYRLGKWLRAAGHDTMIITTPLTDREILSLALTENRLLISRDYHFLNMKGAQPILIYLKSNDFESCIKEMNQKIKIDWLYAPFTRCLNCNSQLEEMLLLECLELISSEIRREKNQFWYCPVCHQFYWEGSHTKRMFQQLKIWQKDSTDAS